MLLLISAIDKLPDISGLIATIICDKNNPNSMMQKYETCKHLSPWHEFTKKVIDENDQSSYSIHNGKKIKMITPNK